jgi:hypothetical protein
MQRQGVHGSKQVDITRTPCVRILLKLLALEGLKLQSLEKWREKDTLNKVREEGCEGFGPFQQHDCYQTICSKECKYTEH